MTTSDTTITPPNGNGAARSAEKPGDRTRTSTSSLVDAAVSAGDELGTAAKAEFNNIMADLQDLVARAGRLSGQELAVIRQQISEKLSQAKDKLHHLSEDASVAAHKGVDTTEKLIKDHPFQAVGIAALAGVILGALISRR
ncbi:MAG: DUF883 family protein [Cellvibrio sp.]|jgi:Uncharacterized conserved protein